MDCSMAGSSVFHSLPEFAQIHVCWVSDAISPSHPPSPPSPPAFNLSQHQGPFQWGSSSHQVAKVLKLQLSISSSNEYSRLIFLRLDWFDILADQRTLKSFLQHNSKASIFLCSSFFKVQLSHPNMTTGKSIALSIWTFVSKVMSLLFNMLLGLS